MYVFTSSIIRLSYHCWLVSNEIIQCIDLMVFLLTDGNQTLKKQTCGMGKQRVGFSCSLLS